MHVSKISIARLFNLGNFEHKRIEVTVDFDHSANPFTPSETITELSDILETLGPCVNAQRALVEGEQANVRIHEAGLVRDPDSDYDKEWLQIHKDRLEAAQAELSKLTTVRAEALKRLDALGGFVTQG